MTTVLGENNGHIKKKQQHQNKMSTDSIMVRTLTPLEFTLNPQETQAEWK